jgi:hypothetical protein
MLNNEPLTSNDTRGDEGKMQPMGQHNKRKRRQKEDDPSPKERTSSQTGNKKTSLCPPIDPPFSTPAVVHVTAADSLWPLYDPPQTLSLSLSPVTSSVTLLSLHPPTVSLSCQIRSGTPTASKLHLTTWPELHALALRTTDHCLWNSNLA